MKSSTLALLTGILLSPLALADEACDRSTQDFLFKNSEAQEYDRHPTPFDLKARIADAYQRAGLNGSPSLLSCQAGRPLCLKSEGDIWTLLSDSGPQELSSEKKKSNIILSHVTRFHAGGDPWYGIGAQDWTRELRMTLNPTTLTIKTLLIDGAETTFGISKRTRAEGSCKRIAAGPIRQKIRARTIEELFLSLKGSPAAQNGAIEANFLIDSSGSLHQITSLRPETAEVVLLELETGNTRRVSIEALSTFKSVNVMAILRDMSRLRNHAGLNPDGISFRYLRCIQGANALLNPSNETRNIRYSGFTEIELTRSATGPGADLGYSPLSKFRITRAGWEGNYRPATLPFGRLEAVAVTDSSGNASFIAAGPNGIQARPILKMDARTAGERHGLPANLIAFEDTLCFAR